MTLSLRTAIVASALVASAFAQNATVGEAEAQRCEEKIAAAQRDVLGRYEDALLELQNGFQKAADLESALAVRAERQRVKKEGKLTDQNLVAEPKSLRTLQSTNLTKIKDLTAQLVQETLPKLVELKRSLTIAGKLDDALAVRSAIERLQNGYVPVTRIDAGTGVTADALLLAYSADRARADQIYKGQKIAVRGAFGGFRADPNDSKMQLVYIAGSSGGWVQCAFALSDFRFREEQQFGTNYFVITPRGSDAAAVRLQKGQQLEVSGVCQGLDELVRLTKCELSR